MLMTTMIPKLECYVIMQITSLGISVITVSDYGLDDRAIEVRSSAEAKGFFL
jgi:hypothetical protein